MRPTDPTKYLTIQETADRLGVSKRSVWRYIQRGDLEAVRPAPRKTFVRRSSLAAFMAANQATVTATKEHE